MKTIITVVLALATMFAGAVEKPRLDIYPVKDGKAVVALANENPATFVISLKTNEGSTVYYNKAKESNTGYRKMFDFSELEDGAYQLSVKVNTTTISRNIQITDGTLHVSESELRFDPYFAFADGVLKISYLNFDKEDLSITIMDDGEVLYEAELGNDFNNMVGYDLSKLNGGTYRVILAGGNEDYSYTIKK